MRGFQLRRSARRYRAVSWSALDGWAEKCSYGLVGLGFDAYMDHRSNDFARSRLERTQALLFRDLVRGSTIQFFKTFSGPAWLRIRWPAPGGPPFSKLIGKIQFWILRK